MIAENILKLRERINFICSTLSKAPAAIKIVAVSKGRKIEEIKQVVQSGIDDIGENRVQEGAWKHQGLCVDSQCLDTRWHLVGHLQTNKAKEAVKIFDLIQSVDSLYLAQEIARQAAKINKIQDVLIQVKTSAEATKFGLKPEAVVEITREIARLQNIKIRGLMTIAPLMDNPEKTRPYFRMLKEIFDGLNNLEATAQGLEILSMGMSDDFKVAVEEGSNMLRLGRAIFEE